MIKSTIVKYNLQLLTIGMILTSPAVNSASFDLLEQQNLNHLKLQDSEFGESFFDFDFFQQKESDKNKNNYLETLELIKNKQFKEAGNKINALLKENPEEAEFYNLKALLATLKKDPDLAMKSYKKAIELDQKNLKAHLAMAKVFFDAGDINQAKAYSNKALVINDKAIYAYFLLAEIARKQKKLQDAENLLLAAKQNIQGNVQREIAVAKNLGTLYVLKKQPEKTLSLAEDIVNQHPDNSSALSLLASAQLVNNQKELLEETLKKLINQEKQDIQHRLILAKLMANQPKKEKNVLQLLDEISLIAPNNPQALTQKAILLINLKRYQEAQEVAAKINKLVPKTGLSQSIEGEIYLAEKRLDRALPSFLKAYKIKPSGKILTLIVDILVAKRMHSDAINFLIKELKKDEKNLAAHFKLATIYQQQQNPSKTEKHYKAVLDLDPKNVLALNNLAWHYHEQHNNTKALELVEQAYKLAPTVNVADTYGTILIGQGNLKQGIAILKKATTLAPDNFNIQYHLAKAYSSNNNHNQAIRILNRIVKTDKSFSEKSSATSLLNKLGNEMR